MQKPTKSQIESAYHGGS